MLWDVKLSAPNNRNHLNVIDLCECMNYNMTSSWCVK